MSSYRVLVVTNLWPSDSDPSFGGFVQAQMDSLRPLGVDYDVLYIKGSESHWNYVRAIFELRRRLKQKTFDLIHAHFGLSGWVARFQFQIPVVISFMGDDVLGRFKRNGHISPVGRIFQFSSCVLSRLAPTVIVKSQAMKTALGLSSAHVIPNGVDLNLFRPMDCAEARRALGLQADKKFVLFPFSPFNENKRYDLVQAAVSSAKHQIPELEILTVFDVPRSKMPLYLNAADMLVLASYSEGSSNVVKEAMAVNLPVVTVDVGDARDLIGSSDGCYLVPREKDAIAAAIVEVCRRGTRTQGRDWIARLSMETVAKQLVDVYASVARGSIKRPSSNPNH